MSLVLGLNVMADTTVTNSIILCVRLRRVVVGTGLQLHDQIMSSQ